MNLSSNRKLVLSLACWLVVLGAAHGDEPVGWRTDGTGRYPRAKPPLEWSPETNLIWKTPLPKASFASPILVGDRLFVTSEPTELFCVRASDGEILWQHSHNYVDVFGEAKAQQIENDLTKAKEIDKQQRELKRELSDLKKKDKPDDSAKKKLEEQIEKLQTQIKALRKYPGVGRGSLPGSRATPTSDGKTVYAAFGNGIVSAHSLDGEQRWMRHIESPALGFGQATSPLLVGGLLIVHFSDMVALDPATGKERWRTELNASYGSPIRTKVGQVELIVSPSGAIVRAADGKILVEKLQRLPETSPIVHEDVLYLLARGRKQPNAMRLVPADGDSVTVEPLWTTEISRPRRFASWVYHDGLLYGYADNYLEVVDAKTGESVYRERLPLRGRSYSSVTLAGDRLFVSCDRGRTVVVEPGRKYEQVMLNELESVGSCPLFVGDRLYLRTHKHLYAIGKSSSK